MTNENMHDMKHFMSALKMLLQGPTKENVDMFEELLKDDFNTAVTDVNDMFAAMDAKQKVQVHMDVSRLKATIRDVQEEAMSEESKKFMIGIIDLGMMTYAIAMFGSALEKRKQQEAIANN